MTHDHIMGTNGRYVTLRISRLNALALDLLVCSCGHRENNHFMDQAGKPCAHCECKSYQEMPRMGQLIKTTT